MNETKRITKGIFGLDRAPLALPWFKIMYGNHPVSKVHRQVFKNEWNSYGLGRVRLMLQTMLWPLLSGRNIIGASRMNGRRVQQRFGISLIKQVWHQLVFANIYNILPEHYYYYRLFSPHNGLVAQALLIESVKTKLLDYLNKGTDCTHLNDKAIFHNRCTDCGLPVIPLLAVIHDKQTILPIDGNLGLPHGDVFIKRSRSYRGIGAELWQFIPERNSWSNQGKILCEEELIQHLIGQSSNCEIIMQPRIKNHPALAGLSLDGLCTVRVVTYRFPNGEMGVLLSVLRMPRGLSQVDNCSAGGIGAAFCLETGILGKGYLMETCSSEILRHPDTGFAIDGVEVPHWRDIVELAIRAHKVFSEFAFLGWDIALSVDGPLIVECNTNWGAWIAQVPTGQYLGNTKFVDCFMRHHKNRNT
jgi:hypothetical protein